MPYNGLYFTAAVATVGVAGGVYYAYKIYKESNKKLPEDWVPVGTLSNIYCYPVKSCAPIILNEAECSLMGLRDSWLRDRVLMVVDSDNNHVTARTCPEMLLVQPNIKGSVLTLTHHQMESISVNLAEVAESEKITTAMVWSDPVPVYNCGKEVAAWFSKTLSKPGLQLVYYASTNCRKIRSSVNTKLFKFTKNDSGALPDETSFNLINEASVQDLNSKLQRKISHRNFRPNFVIKGAKPLDEDNWHYIKIGENIFEILKPCGRCLLTTTDPETGIKDSEIEPLRTLRTYRIPEDRAVRIAMSSAPRMGVQMTLRSSAGGLVRLDDPIYVA